MKFTCEKNALVSAVSVASRTVAQKSTIPALEGIYIRAGVKLTLSGYNLETGITISVDAEIQQTGACIMPSRLFFDIIRKLPDDTVSISVDEKFKVSIRGGISSFSITAMSSEDYPELPEVESDKGISLPQNELKAMIGGTSFAVSENQARPIHTGCLFEVEDSSITVVAVDGYRLALARAGIPYDEALVYEGDYSFACGAPAFEKLYAQGVTAICCASDKMAVGVIHAAQAAGLSVPEDFSVTGYDNDPVCNSIYPGLTTLSQDFFRVGQVAATLMHCQLHGMPMGPVSIIPPLLVRSSTAEVKS